jgi:hypothetical protein
MAMKARMHGHPRIAEKYIRSEVSSIGFVSYDAEWPAALHF